MISIIILFSNNNHIVYVPTRYRTQYSIKKKNYFKKKKKNSNGWKNTILELQQLIGTAPYDPYWIV